MSAISDQDDNNSSIILLNSDEDDDQENTLTVKPKLSATPDLMKIKTKLKLQPVSNGKQLNFVQQSR